MVFGGGVSCNSGIIAKFKENESVENYVSYFPKFEYTTDNAAMIAMVGYLKYNNKDFSSIEKGAKGISHVEYAIIFFTKFIRKR